MSTIGMTSDGLYPIYSSIGEMRQNTWGASQALMDKAKGVGTIGITTPGAMNATYGPYLQNLQYNKHNTLALLGSRNYRTGYRFQESLSYTRAQSAGVKRGGYAPAGNIGGYLQFEQPYKVLAKRTPMSLGYMQLGSQNLDDVSTWEEFFRLEGDSWLWAQNNDVVRRIEDAPPVGLGQYPAGDTTTITDTEIVGYESIERIISNSTEGGFLPAGQNIPWKMGTNYALPSAGDALEIYRNPNATGFKGVGNGLDAYVDANYDANTTTGAATLRQLTLNIIDSLFTAVMPFMENNKVAGKTVVTGYDTLQKMQQLLQPQQRYLGYQAAQVTDEGVSTLPGQNTGFMVATYNQAALMPDLMIAKGYGNTAGGHAEDGISRILFFDQNQLYNAELLPITVEMSDNSLVNGRYIRMADMHRFGEIQASNGPFKGFGKVLHLQ